jgi:thiol-disulfide isomerase/thioredoxin
MKKTFLILFLIVFSGLLIKTDFSLAQQKVEINFFYSAICPHCAKEEEFLKELKSKYPEVEIKEYEVISNPENQKILQDFYEKYKVPERERGYVPVTFTPTKYFIGFNEQIGAEIESCIKECLAGEKPIPQKIKIPIFGEIDLSKISLFTLTLIFGALDGLNPCAMWVLLFLISLLINTRSRKRMFLVGGTFILASGIIYFLILAGWLKLFLAISYVNLTRILIGLFSLGLGIWQIRTFVRYKGVCPIAEGDKFKGKIRNGLMEEAKKIVSSPLTPAILVGIIFLALGINLVEFFCSAGLPAIYTRVLALNKLGSLSYYLYLLLYTFIFMLDDIIVLSLAIITLSRIGFTEKYNYWATLIGGLLIFALGILLIFKPEFLMFG